jgi:hypothetical protein
LTSLKRDPKIGWGETVVFLRETQDAIFLFGPEIVDYLDSLYKKSLDMTALQEKFGLLPVGPERSDLCAEESRLVRELTGELPKLPEVFGAYLKFKAWKR